MSASRQKGGADRMSASRQKGTAWASKCVQALQEAGWPHAELRALLGARDKGDITGVDPGLVIECKNEQKQDLAEWLDEAIQERENAGAAVGVVWHHRRGKSSAEEGYVTMTGGDFLTLLYTWTGCPGPEQCRG